MAAIPTITLTRLYCADLWGDMAAPDPVQVVTDRHTEVIGHLFDTHLRHQFVWADIDRRSDQPWFAARMVRRGPAATAGDLGIPPVAVLGDDVDWALDYADHGRDHLWAVGAGLLGGSDPDRALWEVLAEMHAIVALLLLTERHRIATWGACFHPDGYMALLERARPVVADLTDQVRGGAAIAEMNHSVLAMVEPVLAVADAMVEQPSGPRKGR